MIFLLDFVKISYSLHKSMWWGAECNIELGPPSPASNVLEAKMNCRPDQCVAGYKGNVTTLINKLKKKVKPWLIYWGLKHKLINGRG